MSRFLKLVLAALVLVLMASCTSAHFEKVNSGQALETPIDLKIMEKSILMSLGQYNWNVTDRTDGVINARYSKSGDLIIAQIGVEYNSDGYEIFYQDSKNLDANLDRMTIHKNYNRWIANLNKTIYNNYLLLSVE